MGAPPGRQAMRPAFALSLALVTLVAPGALAGPAEGSDCDDKDPMAVATEGCYAIAGDPTTGAFAVCYVQQHRESDLEFRAAGCGAALPAGVAFAGCTHARAGGTSADDVRCAAFAGQGGAAGKGGSASCALRNGTREPATLEYPNRIRCGLDADGDGVDDAGSSVESEVRCDDTAGGPSCFPIWASVTNVPTGIVLAAGSSDGSSRNVTLQHHGHLLIGDDRPVDHRVSCAYPQIDNAPEEKERGVRCVASGGPSPASSEVCDDGSGARDGRTCAAGEVTWTQTHGPLGTPVLRNISLNVQGVLRDDGGPLRAFWTGGCSQSGPASGSCAWNGPAGTGTVAHDGLPPEHSNVILADMDADGTPDLAIRESGGSASATSTLAGCEVVAGNRGRTPVVHTCLA